MIREGRDAIMICYFVSDDHSAMTHVTLGMCDNRMQSDSDMPVAVGHSSRSVTRCMRFPTLNRGIPGTVM